MFVEMHTCRYLGPRDEEWKMPKARPEGPPLRGFRSPVSGRGSRGSRPSRVSGQRPENHTCFQGRRPSFGSLGSMDKATEKAEQKKKRSRKNSMGRTVRPYGSDNQQCLSDPHREAREIAIVWTGLSDWVENERVGQMEESTDTSQGLHSGPDCPTARVGQTFQRRCILKWLRGLHGPDCPTWWVGQTFQ